MADYRQLKPFILRWEGGWADDPADLGGATMKGITLATYATYRKMRGKSAPSKEDLRNISDKEWDEVFKSMFWDRWNADQIKDQRVANILVDWVWASGVHGIKNPQRLLGLRQDGLVGIKTLQAVNAKGSAFAEELLKARRAFVDRICIARPANNKFKRGWLNRINAL